MGRSASQNKMQQKSGELLVEHNVISEDSFLPSADELAKLNAISPGIIDWIMKRTEIEQNARIKFNDDRVGIAKSEVSHKHIFNYIALFMAFIIVLLFLFLSYKLITGGQEVVGTIFAGGTIAVIVFYFLNAKSNK